MPDLTCFEHAQAKACALAKGWPPGPRTTWGEDSPEGNVTGYWPGDIYVNTTTNEIWYFNGTPGTDSGWYQIIAGGGFVGLFLTSGDPEGVLSASPPSLAYDPTTGTLYIKRTGVGTNTGWESLIG